jgi:peptidyl-prolyl cis-trans isomerase B (cyclophilin B)
MKKYFLIAIAILTLTACVQSDTAGDSTSENGGRGLTMRELTDADGWISKIRQFYADSDMKNLTGGSNGEIFEPIRMGRQELDGTIYETLIDSPSKTLQLTPVEAGEELVVMHTNYGDIVIRLFPQEVPLAVENFVTQAKEGLYDGLIFHRVMEGFMIQGGCPLGRGTGGESIFPEGLGLERSFNLHHFRGAFATAHAGPGRTIGSQFYIVHSSDIPDSVEAEFRSLTERQDEVIGEFSNGQQLRVRDTFPVDMLEHYINYGGTNHLDWQWHHGYGHTVFGHVVSGMDVVDKIAAVQTDMRNDRPIEDVIIESISFAVKEG